MDEDRVYEIHVERTRTAKKWPWRWSVRGGGWVLSSGLAMSEGEARTKGEEAIGRCISTGYLDKVLRSVADTRRRLPIKLDWEQGKGGFTNRWYAHHGDVILEVSEWMRNQKTAWQWAVYEPYQKPMATGEAADKEDGMRAAEAALTHILDKGEATTMAAAETGKGEATSKPRTLYVEMGEHLVIFNNVGRLDWRATFGAYRLRVSKDQPDSYWSWEITHPDGELVASDYQGTPKRETTIERAIEALTNIIEGENMATKTKATKTKTSTKAADGQPEAEPAAPAPEPAAPTANGRGVGVDYFPSKEAFEKAKPGSPSRECPNCHSWSHPRAGNGRCPACGVDIPTKTKAKTKTSPKATRKAAPVEAAAPSTNGTHKPANRLVGASTTSTSTQGPTSRSIPPFEVVGIAIRIHRAALRFIEECNGNRSEAIRYLESMAGDVEE